MERVRQVMRGQGRCGKVKAGQEAARKVRRQVRRGRSGEGKASQNNTRQA